MKRIALITTFIIFLPLAGYSRAENFSANYSLIACVFNSSGSPGQAAASFKAANSVGEPVINLFTSQNYYLKAGFIYNCFFNSPPEIGTAGFPEGTSYSNQINIFTATFTDQNGWKDILYADFLINSSLSGANSFYARYNQNTNLLYLRNDADTEWLGGYPPGSSNIIENSQARIDCSQTQASMGEDNATLKVTWFVAFKPAFAGAKNIYIYAVDKANVNSGWVQAGVLTIQYIAPRPFLNSEQHSFLQELLNTHLNYFLSEDAITSSGLPLGAYKEGDRGRYGYSNTTEWGYALLAWIIAADNGYISKVDAVSRIEKAINTMQSLQNNPSQNYKKLFYPYYYVVNIQGNDIAMPYHDAKVNIPSIDNGFLYTSLLITQGWAKVNGFSSLEAKAAAVKDAMKLDIFTSFTRYPEAVSHSINADTGELSVSKWDIYSDEGGVMAWIVYLSGSITFDQYKLLINRLKYPTKSWNGIIVEEAPWFNAMFAWGVRSWAGFPVATGETGTQNLYSSNSFAKSVKAHLAYGDWLGIYYPAFSDAMTQVGMTGHYTPPNIPGTVPADIPQHIVPHAFFVPFCIGPDLEPDVKDKLISKITDLKSDRAGYYHYGQDGHKPFGFEVTASPLKDDLTYPGVESRYIYETLSQAYIVMSLYQGLNINDGKTTLFNYACQIPGYSDKVKQALEFLYPAQRVLKVPQDYPTIQQAVNAAQRNFTIEVAPGQYTENIIISYKPKFTLKGTIGDYNDPLNTSLNTVINSNGGLGIGLTGSGGVVLDSLVITGANRDYYDSSGGGIFANGEDITISNNIITKNRAARGAGIACGGSRMSILHNIFTENDGHYGGAIRTSGNLATIADNKIFNNLAWAEGAGIEVSYGSASILRNLIYNNKSDWAGGIYLNNAQGGEIKNNLIVGNRADYTNGGGIYSRNSNFLITNNVIHKNNAGSKGNGIYIDGEITPIIKNNIITENQHWPAGGIYNASPSAVSLTYNDVYNNGRDNYVGCAPGTGSISEPPLFVAPDNDNNPYNDDYHLQPGSPCIDAGEPDLQYNDKDGTRNDMGAYGGPDSL